jgi:hypothetical protein
MDELFATVGQNEFIGTIDPKHHSYLSEQLLQESAKKCTVSPGGASTIVCISLSKESSFQDGSGKNAKVNCGRLHDTNLIR